MLFGKPKKAVGIDIGTHSVKVVEMSKIGRGLRVDACGYALVDRHQVSEDPVMAQATAIREAMRSVAPSKQLRVGALPGQTVVIRYPRLPDMPFEKIDEAIQREAAQNIPYDLSEVFIDWALLEKVTEGDEALQKVILVAAKPEVIESRVAIADAAETPYAILTVDSLALADAAEVCDWLRPGENTALVNIGMTSVSVHFVKDGVSNFIRDVSWGARELINAITKDRRCEFGEAERLLADAGASADVEGAQPPALDAAFGEKPTPEPAPSDVGASLLDPFEDELEGFPAEPAAPVELAEPAPEATGSIESLLRVPLGRLVTEVRRSFEYYEHQLYEGAVDRLILSGGVAHIPLLTNTLKEELGIEQIEVANPAQSALSLSASPTVEPLRERPAQFMVAVGLAARGAAEL